jgi:hypothetical protein
MFEEMDEQDPNKDMKIKLLDGLIEKIMAMDDGSEEKAEPQIDSSTEMSQEDDQKMKDKLAAMKGI